MSRINDYVIGEQEAGRMPVEDEPLGPEIVLEDSVPIPDSLLERSDLNEKFGNLPKTIDKMESQSWYTRSNAEERTRLDHMDEPGIPRFDNISRSKCGETINTTLFLISIHIPRYTKESST